MYRYLIANALVLISSQVTLCCYVIYLFTDSSHDELLVCSMRGQSCRYAQ